jgi:outer membrane protein, multidrug efflux system
MHRTSFLIPGLIVIFLAGCTLAPKYTRPEAPVPDAWPTGEAYTETTAAESAPAAAELAWREFFTDPRLQEIIVIALDNNRDLRLASLSVERARAYYGIRRAELLPTIYAEGSGSKEHVPADLSRSGEATTSEVYRVDLGISSWEIDFFGRIRSLKDQALEEYLATDQACRSAQILLLSEVANAWFTLAADRENARLARSTLEAQEASYTVIRKRHDVGIVSALDLRRAQSQVDTARGEVAATAQLVAQDENILNLLAGSPLPPELLPQDLSSVSPPKEISPCLPSEVLLRRPDVLAAEHQLKGANANIGAARAAFFPRISLTAAFGTASADLSGLFKGGQDVWRFAPQVALPIFDARTWSAYRVTKVEREVYVAEYEKTIQTAFREVADVLAVRGTVGQRLNAQQSLVEALTETYRLADARYKKGIDSYLSVLDAQRSLYGGQQGLIALRLARISNLVTMYRVLGGGDT